MDEQEFKAIVVARLEEQPNCWSTLLRAISDAEQIMQRKKKGAKAIEDSLNWFKDIINQLQID